MATTLGLSLSLSAAPGKSDKAARRQARADIPQNVEDQYDRVQKSADALSDLTRTPEKGIPRSLVDE
jgi:hypothetical protein